MNATHFSTRIGESSGSHTCCSTRGGTAWCRALSAHRLPFSALRLGAGSQFEDNLPYQNACWNTADYARSPTCENGKAASATCDGGLPCVPCLIDVKHQLFPKSTNVSVENEFCTTDALEDTLSVRHAIDLLRKATKTGEQSSSFVSMSCVLSAFCTLRSPLLCFVHSE